MGIPRHGEAQPVDDFFLAEHWSFHIYSYRALLELDGVPFEIHPGSASIVPPGTRTVYRYSGTSEHVYFHFRLSDGEPTVELPMVVDLGDSYAAMDERARRAVGRSTHDTAYPRAALWALLCELAEGEQQGASVCPATCHPIVETAVNHIEQRLAGPLTVARLCEEVGVSYGYLGRLFKIWLGCSVLGHVRARRAEHAEHLIVSTTLPIKVVARAVGVPDLQQFNRRMRQVKGASPRAIRARSRNVIAGSQARGS